MALYSKCVSGAALGATADTFNNVGTITLRSDADRLYGLLVQASNTTTTAAEQNSGQIQFTASDLGLGAQICAAPPLLGGGIATHDQSTVSATEFIPFNLVCKGKENLIVDYSTQVTDPTAGSDVVVAAVYTGNKTATDTKMLERMPIMHNLAPRGYDCEANGAVTTVAETAITDLNVPSWASWLCGIRVTAINAAVMTAAEGLAGYVRMRSTMPDFEPQEWPYYYSIHASLGTPVGVPVSMTTPRFWCMSFAYEVSGLGRAHDQVQQYRHVVAVF